MSRLQFKSSPDPRQHVRWALRHAAYICAFLLVVMGLNHADLMRTAYPIVKAVLLIGLLVNLLYFCGYIVIASVKYLGSVYAIRKE